MYGLYIHIPFCKQKCNYCDFVSQPADPMFIESYMKALYLEMTRYLGAQIVTVFAGGGTPSLLSSDSITELFKQVRRNFDCRLSELTVEANPESLIEEKLAVLKMAGVTRLSIGVQSFLEKELKFLGRIHSADDFKQAYHLARKYHFDNINIDMIYGLPEQKLQDWKDNLEKAVSFGSEHISLYPLTIEPGTKFEQMKIKTDENLQADMYEWSIEFLDASGYEHYEISNWARPGFKSTHNLIYWQNQEYIGLGASAASYFKRYRWKNVSNIEKYISLINSQGQFAEEIEEIDESKKLSEEIILKLRCNTGIALTPQIKNKYGDKIDMLMGQILLERAGNNIRLTKRGMLLANQVLREFV